MSNPLYENLVAALDACLGEDESANYSVIERKRGPAVAIIRADVFHVIQRKAREFDILANEGDDTEYDVRLLMHDYDQKYSH